MSIGRLRNLSLFILGLSGLLLAPAAAHGAGPAAGTWTPIPPGGSRVQVLAAALGSATVFAGTAYGGVFRTVDRGATWQAANFGLSGLNVSTLAAAPGGAMLYAGTESGLFRSDDGAASWASLLGFPGAPAALAIAPTAPSTLYAAAATEVYRSDDAGISWTPVLNLGAFATPSALAVDAGSSQHVYLGEGDPGTVLTSRSGGARWRPSLLPGVNDVFALAADPARPGHVLAATDAGIFATTDGGGDWAPAAGLPAGTYSAVAFALGAPGTVYAATDRARGRLWKSTNGGASWRLVLAEAPFTALAGDPLRRQRIYAAATPDGVFHGPLDDGSWRPQQGGLAASSVSSLAIDRHTPGLLYALALLSPPGALPVPLSVALPAATVRVSADGGATWQAAGGNLPAMHRLLADPAATGGAYALAVPDFQGPGRLPASVSTALFHTADEGASWQALTPLSLAVYDVAAVPASPATLFAVGYTVEPEGRPCPFGCTPEVARSTDGGVTWSTNADLPVQFTESAPDPSQWLVRVDPGDPLTVYVTMEGDLLKTTDGGATWARLDAAPSLVDLAIDPAQPQRLYGVRNDDGTAAGSTDGGQTWQELNAGLPVGGVRHLAVGAGAILYAATAAGTFTSNDRGALWLPLGTGLPPISVLTVATDAASPGRVYAGVEGSGGLFVVTAP